MYSGKTEELLRRVRRLSYTKKKVLTVKPKIDNRYSANEIASHCGSKLESLILEDITDLYDYAEYDVIAIDEGQFFGENIIGVTKFLANNGIRVIVAGLDMDFNGDPFPPIPSLMAISEEVTKLKAVCMKCGEDAAFSFLIKKTKNEIVQVGSCDMYEARCRKCFYQ